MVKEQFLGAWELISFEFRHPNGDTTHPMGANAVGILIYDKNGYMSAQIMRADRPLFAVNDQLRGTPTEIQTAFAGFISYFGTYEVNQEESTVVHHLKGSLFPNLVGREQKRFFEFSGDRLILSTPPMPWDGQRVTGYLIWKRAG